MKRTVFLLALLAPALAHAQLEWRVSVKMFTDANGNLGGGANVGTPQAVSNLITRYNAVAGLRDRGYQYVITEMIQLPGTTAPLPSVTNSWFNVPVNAANQDDLDAKARATPGNPLQYRADAVNFYITGSRNSGFGGYCAFPAENQNALLVAQDSFSDVLIHEAGHFFNLSHTHGGASCDTNGVVQGLPGDDGLGDTPVDWPCGTQDTIAFTTFGRLYAQLNAADQYFVDNTWSNIMSYHSPGNRFTSDQLDRMTDASNGARQNVASGRTWFVDLNSSCLNPSGSSFCVLAFGGPFATVTAGVNAANNGDIVLIRAGSYDEVRSYNKPVTLRATRGEARIGPR